MFYASAKKKKKKKKEEEEEEEEYRLPLYSGCTSSVFFMHIEWHWDVNTLTVL